MATMIYEFGQKVVANRDITRGMLMIDPSSDYDVKIENGEIGTVILLYNDNGDFDLGVEWEDAGNWSVNSEWVAPYVRPRSPLAEQLVKIADLIDQHAEVEKALPLPFGYRDTQTRFLAALEASAKSFSLNAKYHNTLGALKDAQYAVVTTKVISYGIGGLLISDMRALVSSAILFGEWRSFFDSKSAIILTRDELDKFRRMMRLYNLDEDYSVYGYNEQRELTADD